jgi:hypothetical protein
VISAASAAKQPFYRRIMTLEKLNELAEKTAFYKDIVNPVRIELQSPTNPPLKLSNGAVTLEAVETSQLSASKIYDEYILRYEFNCDDFPENMDARQLDLFFGSLLNKSKLEYTNATIKRPGTDSSPFRDQEYPGKVELRMFVLAERE